jgi:fused signal recognition particle receptor
MADFLSKWKTGLERTRKVTFGRISNLLGTSQIDSSTWENLETALIQADLGIETTQSILLSLRKTVQSEGISRSGDLQATLRQELISRLLPAPQLDFWGKLAVILVVGVNGSGKTTAIAKLGKLFKDQGKTVVLVAGDTFRAAAVDQLQIWGERLDLPVIASQMGSDPGAIAFDGIQAAISRKADYVFIDTAGRLHTRFNLMEELKKVYRVVAKALPGAPHATWLVLDATTGQNSLQQARAFKDAVNIDAVILAKLDTSARGGMAFAIKEQLGLPIIYAGLGEKPDDLQLFDREAFVDGILSER